MCKIYTSYTTKVCNIFCHNVDLFVIVICFLAYNSKIDEFYVYRLIRIRYGFN